VREKEDVDRKPDAEREDNCCDALPANRKEQDGHRDPEAEDERDYERRTWHQRTRIGDHHYAPADD